MRNLDTQSSFVLSRPRCLPRVPTSCNSIEFNPELAFNATADRCFLLNHIVNTLSNGKLLDIATAPFSSGTKGVQMFRSPGTWGDMDAMPLEGDFLIGIEPFDQLFLSVE